MQSCACAHAVVRATRWAPFFEQRGQTGDCSTQPSEQDSPSQFFYNEAPNVVNVAHISQPPTFENLTACSEGSNLFVNPLITFRSEEHYRHAAEGSTIRQVRAGSIHVVPESDNMELQGSQQDKKYDEGMYSREMPSPENEKGASRKDLMAHERDVKRRRQRFKGKRVKRSAQLALQEYISTRMRHLQESSMPDST